MPGFVTIVGSPNVGKSTLMNALVGERVSIVTSKQQTTRHQIMSVVTGGDFQIVYYDTPGVLRPNYELQEGMMAFVKESLGDADVVLMMTDVFEDPESWSDQEIFQQLQQSKRPLLLAVNKVDVLPNETQPLGKLGKEALQKVSQAGSGRAGWLACLRGVVGRSIGRSRHSTQPTHCWYDRWARWRRWWAGGRACCHGPRSCPSPRWTASTCRRSSRPSRGSSRSARPSTPTIRSPTSPSASSPRR